MSKNYDYLMKADVSKYMGEWIAVSNKQIVSHGNDFKNVFYEAKKAYPNEMPFIALIPDGRTMIL